MRKCEREEGERDLAETVFKVPKVGEKREHFQLCFVFCFDLFCFGRREALTLIY